MIAALRDAFPAGSRYVLRDARLPASVVGDATGLVADSDGFLRADVLIDDGTIARLDNHIAGEWPTVGLDGGQLWPACVELHTHLDKSHTLPRARNPDGTIGSAVEAVRRDRFDHWSAEDVERRFNFSLRCAFAHGTAAIRTHIDSYTPQAPISWPVFERLRQAWSGRIALQGAALTMLDVYAGEEGTRLADTVAAAGGILGGVTRLALPAAEQTAERRAQCLDHLFRLATERRLDVDLHVDETADLEPNTLEEVALAVLRNRFAGRVVCGHCCSLALRAPEQIAATIALVKEAGLGIVTLPLVNQHLQGRIPRQTPRWRGVTLVRELADAGIAVAAASDNCRDPMHAYGDFDAVEVFRETVKICHLDLDCTRWLPLVTKSAAQIMRLPLAGQIVVGASADLIAFRARSWSELFSRPQHDRLVLRQGRPVTTAVPDYRELDAELAPAAARLP